MQLAARVLSAEGDARGDAVDLVQLGAVRGAGEPRRPARGAGRRAERRSARRPAGLRAEVPVEVVRRGAGVAHARAVATAKVRQGDVVRFAATAHDAGNRAVAGLTPTWSFGPGEGHIDADGAFVAYEPGTYTVTAALGGRSATAR